MVAEQCMRSRGLSSGQNIVTYGTVIFLLLAGNAKVSDYISLETPFSLLAEPGLRSWDWMPLFVCSDFMLPD